MTTTKQKPEAKLRDGGISATVWKNKSESGPFFSVELSRTYQDKEGKLRNSSSFSKADLLKVSRLAARAYDLVTEKAVEA